MEQGHKDNPLEFYDPKARAAEKQADRDADAALVASGALTLEQLAHKNAFIPYTIDLSKWTIAHDSLLDDDDDLS